MVEWETAVKIINHMLQFSMPSSALVATIALSLYDQFTKTFYHSIQVYAKLNPKSYLHFRAGNFLPNGA